MFLSETNKLVNIWLNSFHTTLHGGYCVALSLKSHALSPNSSKLSDGCPGSSTSMMSMKVASKNKHLIRLQGTNGIWSISWAYNAIVNSTRCLFYRLT